MRAKVRQAVQEPAGDTLDAVVAQVVVHLVDRVLATEHQLAHTQARLSRLEQLVVPGTSIAESAETRAPREASTAGLVVALGAPPAEAEPTAIHEVHTLPSSIVEPHDQLAAASVTVNGSNHSVAAVDVINTAELTAPGEPEGQYAVPASLRAAPRPYAPHLPPRRRRRRSQSLSLAMRASDLRALLIMGIGALFTLVIVAVILFMLSMPPIYP